MTKLEELTNEELWAELRRYKMLRDTAWLNGWDREYDQLKEQVGEIEAEVTRRDQ